MTHAATRERRLDSLRSWPPDRAPSPPRGDHASSRRRSRGAAAAAGHRRSKATPVDPDSPRPLAPPGPHAGAAPPGCRRGGRPPARCRRRLPVPPRPRVRDPPVRLLRGHRGPAAGPLDPGARAARRQGDVRQGGRRSADRRHAGLRQRRLVRPCRGHGPVRRRGRPVLARRRAAGRRHGGVRRAGHVLAPPRRVHGAPDRARPLALGARRARDGQRPADRGAGPVAAGRRATGASSNARCASSAPGSPAPATPRRSSSSRSTRPCGCSTATARASTSWIRRRACSRACWRRARSRSSRPSGPRTPTTSSRSARPAGPSSPARPTSAPTTSRTRTSSTARARTRTSSPRASTASSRRRSTATRARSARSPSGRPGSTPSGPTTPTLLETIAGQSAVALGRARLIEELGRSREALARRAEEERTLREIGARLATIGSDPGDLLLRIVHEAARLLGAERARLDLVDPVQGAVLWTYPEGSPFTDAPVLDTPGRPGAGRPRRPLRPRGPARCDRRLHGRPPVQALPRGRRGRAGGRRCTR